MFRTKAVDENDGLLYTKFTVSISRTVFEINRSQRMHATFEDVLAFPSLFRLSLLSVCRLQIGKDSGADRSPSSAESDGAAWLCAY